MCFWLVGWAGSVFCNQRVKCWLSWPILSQISVAADSTLFYIAWKFDKFEQIFPYSTYNKCTMLTHNESQLGHEIGDIIIEVIEQDKNSPYTRVLFKFDGDYEDMVGDKKTRTFSMYL